MASSNQERSRVDILLLGKAGGGKSSTGNSILMDKKFRVASSMGAVTKTFEKQSSSVGSVQVTVVEGPTVECALSGEQGIDALHQKIQPAFEKNPGGFHAIAFIVPFGEEIYESEIQTIKNLELIFGKNYFENHLLLLITNGDKFQNDIDDGNIPPKTPVEEWALQRNDKYFMELFYLCQRRMLVFNNTKLGADFKRQQAKRLIDLVRNMSPNRFTIISVKRHSSEPMDTCSDKRSLSHISEDKKIVPPYITVGNNFLSNTSRELPKVVMNEFCDLLQEFDGIVKQNSDRLQGLLDKVNRVSNQINSKRNQDKVSPSLFLMHRFAEDFEREIERYMNPPISTMHTV